MNTIYNNGIDVSVNINGRPARAYLHEGKYFIESREGTEYSIEIKNNNWYRVEAVVAVDGLSVLNGKTASKKDSGYIIERYDKIVVKGYRKDLNEVGAFKFTRKSGSYAASKGDGSNVGVIAIAIYKEKVTSPIVTWTTIPSIQWDSTRTTTAIAPKHFSPPTTGTGENFVPSYGTCNTNLLYRDAGVIDHNTHTFRSNSCNVAGATNNNNSQTVYCSQQSVQHSTPEFEHGTTWGTKVQDKVVTTTFERDYLVCTQEIYYNSRNNLEAMGIKLVQEKQVTLPRAFPADFCEPPTNWNG